ncbi:MAG: hypothetical protein NTV31_08510 [Bacteroidia bacterium]|nr:hypothetical protein [Bacteroidia bacterium]
MKAFLCTLLILLNCFCPGKAQNKYESVKSERIYLHTDRDVYIAGDNLFYTLYLNGSPGHLSKYAYLILRDRYNLPVTQVRVEISSQTAFGNIYLPDTLRSDIYQVICYTNWMRNEGEDSYFTKEIVIANRFDKKSELFDSTLYTYPSATFPGQYSTNIAENGNLVIHLDKQVFNPREKVTFSIETKDIPGDSITRLSVSVSEIVPGIPDEPSITDYLSSIIKTTKTVEPRQNHYSYQPEIQGTAIQGRVLHIQQSGNLPAISNRDIETDKKTYTILVSTPDSIANMQYITTDSSGSFRFLLNPYYEGKELIIRLKENDKAVIELDNKFKLFQPFIPSGLLNVPGINSYLIRSVNISEVQKYYTERAETNTRKEFEHSVAIPRVYYKPYSKVFPADYLPLPDFVEISRELLPALKVRKSNDNYILSFIYTRNTGFPDTEPMIFLDGVPINDVNQIINLGTDQIKRIDVLPVIRYYGEMPISGILAIFSKNLEINNIQFKTPTIRCQPLLSQSYTKPIHYIPNYVNKHIPDVRQVLLWDPEIILRNNEKQQIECYTSDLRGNYRISIQGITSNGLTVNGSAIITVKSKSN